MNNKLNPIVDIPYPKIDIKEKDPKFAYKIFKLYAGEVSEFTAVSQYSYQSIYLNEYKELSKILEDIAITEMRHLKILGELIKVLGLNPYYVTYNDNRPIPWDADNVNFTINYREMLVSDIEKEKLAINDYNKLASETNIQNIKDIINRIIMDEKRHIEVLSILLKQYDEEQ